MRQARAGKFKTRVLFFALFTAWTGAGCSTNVYTPLRPHDFEKFWEPKAPEEAARRLSRNLWTEMYSRGESVKAERIATDRDALYMHLKRVTKGCEGSERLQRRTEVPFTLYFRDVRVIRTELVGPRSGWLMLFDSPDRRRMSHDEALKAAMLAYPVQADEMRCDLMALEILCHNLVRWDPGLFGPALLWGERCRDWK